MEHRSLFYKAYIQPHINHVDAFFFKQRWPHGRLVVPNGSPSLNKELTYLLTLLMLTPNDHPRSSTNHPYTSYQVSSHLAFVLKENPNTATAAILDFLWDYFSYL